MARWHETHEIHNGTRPTEFSTFIHELGKIEKSNWSSIQKSHFSIFLLIKKKIEVQPWPTLKNRNFESKYELKKAMSQFEIYF